MGNDPSIPWFIALALVVIVSLALSWLTQQRLKTVTHEGWMNAGAWSLFANNSFGSSIRFMRFVYGKESYRDARLRAFKWALRLCHVTAFALFTYLLTLTPTPAIG